MLFRSVILGGGGRRRYPGGGGASANHSAGTADIARDSGGDTFPVDDASLLAEITPDIDSALMQALSAQAEAEAGAAAAQARAQAEQLHQPIADDGYARGGGNGSADKADRIVAKEQRRPYPVFTEFLHQRHISPQAQRGPPVAAGQTELPGLILHAT